MRFSLRKRGFFFTLLVSLLSCLLFAWRGGALCLRPVIPQAGNDEQKPSAAPKEAQRTETER
jgi:hypothetical protein